MSSTSSPSPGRRRIIAIAVGAALLVGGGIGVTGALAGSGGDTETSQGDGPGQTATSEALTTTERPTTTVRPTTTAPPTTTVPPTTTTTRPDAASDGKLELGEGGDAVLALQNRLVELGYWLGSADGNYGQLTRQAVMAFQKAEGLGRDGVAGPITRDRLAGAQRQGSRAGGTGIEIDLERQILMVVEGGQVQWVINTSTGNNETYTSSTGGSAVAATPPGSFTIDREIDGLREAPLGTLYRPKYFNGGIAVHGSGSIPAHPASHGCARVTNSAMDMLWSSGVAQIGTRVTVY
ncbi:MAG TPA: L,D-transpeptidase family protein [Acidimicrobiales bacterium]|nr:L,D-transpeptidase family protein [Acidimicrobiales bacterium]